MKICSDCNIEKELTAFEFRTERNKYRNICKECKAKKRINNIPDKPLICKMCNIEREPFKFYKGNNICRDCLSKIYYAKKEGNPILIPKASYKNTRHAKTPGNAEAWALYNIYKHRAHHKYKLAFELNIEQFKVLIKKNCTYCGSEPISNKQLPHSKEPYLYNGLDRIDSSKGYYVENVQTCCAICNYAKNDMSLEQFKAWVQKIHQHLFR